MPRTIVVVKWQTCFLCAVIWSLPGFCHFSTVISLWHQYFLTNEKSKQKSCLLLVKIKIFIFIPSVAFHSASAESSHWTPSNRKLKLYMRAWSVQLFTEEVQLNVKSACEDGLMSTTVFSGGVSCCNSVTEAPYVWTSESRLTASKKTGCEGVFVSIYLQGLIH